MIWFFTPYAHDKKLLDAIGCCFNLGYESVRLGGAHGWRNCLYSVRFWPCHQTSRLADCGFISFNDSGLNNALKIWLSRQFPNPSKWETSDLEDRTLEILKWAEGDRDFAHGINLFEKYMHSENLVNVFRKGGSEALRKKLEYKLINSNLSKMRKPAKNFRFLLFLKRF